MGCGCAKKISKSRRMKQELMKKRAAEKNGSVIRKRRVNKLISVPGRSPKRKTVPSGDK
tara:strand:+ start:146 stop:322 length:177 start_codon:yes stop_codon:yes gene_type:complete